MQIDALEAEKSGTFCTEASVDIYGRQGDWRTFGFSDDHRKS